MCVMQVRPGQRSSTMAQAMAHNVSTCERDLDMYIALLSARGQHEAASECRDAQTRLHGAYEMLLGAFTNEIVKDVAHGHNPDEQEWTGNERDLHAGLSADDVDMAHDAALLAAQHAKPYETR